MELKFSLAILIATFFIVGLSVNYALAQQEEEEKQQIIIKDNIKDSDSYGLQYKSDYVGTFTPEKAFDNKLITKQEKNVGWSQLGDSGFTVDLQNPLEKSVCSAEIYVLNPKNNPYLLTIGNKSFEGKLDSTIIPVNFVQNCVPSVSQIKLDIQSPNNVYNPIEEIKLFTQKKIPPIEPPVCPPNSYWDDKLKKCVLVNPPLGNETAIINSTIALNVSNSTITITLDDSSEIINQTPIGTPLNENNNEDEQEEDKDNNNNKGDDKN